MERVFSSDEIAGPFWPSSSSAASASPEDRKAMGRCDSEWAFQRFIQETDEAKVLPPPPPLQAPGSDRGAVDTEYLKRQLDLACAAAAATLFRASGSEVQESSLMTNMRTNDLEKVQPGTHAPAKGPNYNFSKEKVTSGPAGSSAQSSLPNVGSQIRSANSGSSREHSEDDDFEGEVETNQNMDPADAKKYRRMLSNRESARRSRRRKQAHLTDLEAQVLLNSFSSIILFVELLDELHLSVRAMKVSQLRVENSALLKRLTEINQKFNEAAVNSRILKADVETMRAKVKMAEDTVKRVTGLNPMFPNMGDFSSISMPFSASPPDASSDAAVPVHEDPSQFLQEILDVELDTPQGNGNDSTGRKMGRTTSMHRVASLEHLQKRFHGGPNAGGSPIWEDGSNWDKDSSGLN